MYILNHCSVTCFSESLRCMCHPKGTEHKYRIAAKATPRKSVAKAGHVMQSKLVEATVVKTLLSGDGKENNERSKAITDAVVVEAASQWRRQMVEVRETKE